MATPVITIGDFSFLIQLVDSGIIQASFKFKDLRAMLEGFGIMTPEIDAAFDIVEANPELLEWGIAQLRDALTRYPPETPISEIFGGGQPTTPTGPSPVTLTPTIAQLEAGFKALAGIAETSAKATAEFIKVNGVDFLNPFYAKAQQMLQWEAARAAGQPLPADFFEKLVEVSADTSALAIQVYNFFTGKTPTEAGMTYLIDSAANPNDLTDPYYLPFSTENRYINLAASLGREGEGRAAFEAEYGSLTFREAVTKLYAQIIGNAEAQAAGITVSAAIDYVVSKEAYFRALGIDDIGAKAAVAGFLMHAGLTADVGIYNEATRDYLAELFDGTATFNVDLLSQSAPAEVGMVGMVAAPADYGMAA